MQIVQNSLQIIIQKLSHCLFDTLSLKTFFCDQNHHLSILAEWDATVKKEPIVPIRGLENASMFSAD